MNAVSFFSTGTRAAPDVAEAIELACRLHGVKRGEETAARLLGGSERTIRAVRYGEKNGASVAPDIAFVARMALRRQRAEQIRAELRQLEIEDAGNLEGAGASVGAGW